MKVVAVIVTLEKVNAALNQISNDGTFSWRIQTRYH